MTDGNSSDNIQQMPDVRDAGYTPKTISTYNRAGEPVEIEVWVPPGGSRGCATAVVAALVHTLVIVSGITFVVQNY